MPWWRSADEDSIFDLRPAMKIAMLVPGLAPYDAVSNDTLGMTAALRTLGHEVALFAPQAKGIDEPVHPPETIERWLDSPDAAVIYHYCTGWDFPVQLFRRVRAHRILRYHNITPPEFFEGWSEGYVAACADGRAQLSAYAAMQCELYLGCSPFNNRDFIERGADPAHCAVLPPFHQVERLLATDPDARRLPDRDGAPLLLMVGRIAPNKNDLALIDALAASREAIDRGARLVRVGKLDPNLTTYGIAMREHMRIRDVEQNVIALEDASDAELRAAYAAADALVMLSAHEGFCVPLIEAMALGTPVIALGSSAIPWTLQGAGLVWDEADPHVIAASIARLRSDPDLRRSLISLGKARYRSAFAPAVLIEELREALTRVAAVPA
jgi:glycosyltransferase involved in cell wall biosynthesis